LRKWWRRYLAAGEAGLLSHSRRPLSSPTLKLTDDVRHDILALRSQRKLGPKALQAAVLRERGLHLSTASIWKVLNEHAAPPLSSAWRKPGRHVHRYERPVPGERVQMDTMKVAPGIIQFTAVDDCTRWRVLGVYERRTATNAAHFLEERVLEEMPFPVQRVQTDRGGEFFGEAFQDALQRNAVKFRPNRPRSPHLNGKVERSQQTDLREFWPTIDLSDKELTLRIEEWQFFYNHHRPHSSLAGKTPAERYRQRASITPLHQDLEDSYDAQKETQRIQHWLRDRAIWRLKRSP
jgi:transposase InsO family protein